MEDRRIQIDGSDPNGQLGAFDGLGSRANYEMAIDHPKPQFDAIGDWPKHYSRVCGCGADIGERIRHSMVLATLPDHGPASPLSSDWIGYYDPGKFDPSPDFPAVFAAVSANATCSHWEWYLRWIPHEAFSILSCFSIDPVVIARLLVRATPSDYWEICSYIVAREDKAAYPVLVAAALRLASVLRNYSQVFVIHRCQLSKLGLGVRSKGSGLDVHLIVGDRSDKCDITGPEWVRNDVLDNMDLHAGGNPASGYRAMRFGDHWDRSAMVMPFFVMKLSPGSYAVIRRSSRNSRVIYPVGFDDHRPMYARPPDMDIIVWTRLFKTYTAHWYGDDIWKVVATWRNDCLPKLDFYFPGGSIRGPVKSLPIFGVVDADALGYCNVRDKELNDKELMRIVSSCDGYDSCGSRGPKCTDCACDHVDPEDLSVRYLDDYDWYRVLGHVGGTRLQYIPIFDYRMSWKAGVGYQTITSGTMGSVDINYDAAKFAQCVYRSDALRDDGALHVLDKIDDKRGVPASLFNAQGDSFTDRDLARMIASRQPTLDLEFVETLCRIYGPIVLIIDHVYRFDLVSDGVFVSRRRYRGDFILVAPFVGRTFANINVAYAWLFGSYQFKWKEDYIVAGRRRTYRVIINACSERCVEIIRPLESAIVEKSPFGGYNDRGSADGCQGDHYTSIQLRAWDYTNTPRCATPQYKYKQFLRGNYSVPVLAPVPTYGVNLEH